MKISAHMCKGANFDYIRVQTLGLYIHVRTCHLPTPSMVYTS